MKLENGRNRKRMLILNVLPKWLSGKESAFTNAGDSGDMGLIPG